MSKGSSTPVERGDSRVSSDLWIVPTQRVPGKALSGKYSQPAPCSRVESNRWVPRNPYVPFDGGGCWSSLPPTELSGIKRSRSRVHSGYVPAPIERVRSLERYHTTKTTGGSMSAVAKSASKAKFVTVLNRRVPMTQNWTVVIR